MAWPGLSEPKKNEEVFTYWRGWYGLSEVNRGKKGIHVGLDGSSPGRLLTYRRIDQISMYFTDNGSQQLSL